MKKYLLFMYDYQHPEGGMHDLIGAHATLQEILPHLIFYPTGTMKKIVLKESYGKFNGDMEFDTIEIYDVEQGRILYQAALSRLQ